MSGVKRAQVYRHPGATKSSAKNGIESVKKNAPAAEVRDLTEAA
ncbi:MAG: DUF1508 domain-containing protein [Rhodothermales bacterium]